jgi:signal transduction histidine kinase
MYQITRQLSSRFHERLAERTRIARALHDTLLQGVLSASMQLDLAEDQLPDDSPSRPRLKRVMELLGKVTEEGRGTLRDKLSLERAFSFMKRDLGYEEKIDYRVVVRGEPVTLRPLIRDQVYRMGREALVNAFRHARAKSIEVEVEYASRQFRKVVRDDRSGIAPEVRNQGREGHGSYRESASVPKESAPPSIC